MSLNKQLIVERTSSWSLNSKNDTSKHEADTGVHASQGGMSATPPHFGAENIVSHQAGSLQKFAGFFPESECGTQDISQEPPHH